MAHLIFTYAGSAMFSHVYYKPGKGQFEPVFLDLFSITAPLRNLVGYFPDTHDEF